MENGWKLVVILVLAAVAGVLLRRRFLTGDAPLRHWFDTRVAPLGGKLFTAFCFLTLAAWIALWAVASPEERARLPGEFQKVLRSMEWGQKDKPGAANSETKAPAPAPPVHGPEPEPETPK